MLATSHPIDDRCFLLHTIAFFRFFLVPLITPLQLGDHFAVLWRLMSFAGDLRSRALKAVALKQIPLSRP